MGTVVNHQKRNGEMDTSVDDFTQRIAQAIDGEKKKAKELGEQEASLIIAEARQLAQQITKEAMTKAEEESARYMAELSQKAEQRATVLKEEVRSKAEAESAKIVANSFDEAEQILARAAQAAEQESSKILANSKKEAEQIIGEAAGRAEKEANEVRSKVQKEFGECARVISEARQKLEQAAKVAEEIIGKESEHPSEAVTKLNVAEERAQLGEPMIDLETSVAPAEEGGAELYQGRVELEIMSDGRFGEMCRLMEDLRNVPNLGLISLGTPVNGKAMATVGIAKPLPLTSILREMAPVESVVGQGHNIQVGLVTRRAT